MFPVEPPLYLLDPSQILITSESDCKHKQRRHPKSHPTNESDAPAAPRLFMHLNQTIIPTMDSSLLFGAPACAIENESVIGRTELTEAKGEK